MLLFISVAFAGLNPDRVQKLVDSGKPDKAWDLCDETAKKAGMIPSDAMDACANAAYGVLTAAGTSSADDLDAFAIKWSTTAAAVQAKQAAAKLRLADAGQQIDKLAAVTAKYPDTQAGKEAMDQAWTLTDAIHTAGGWRQYAQLFPTSPRQQEAVQKEMDLAYDEAAALGTEAGWSYFLESWPMHPRRSDAKKALDDLRYTTAVAAGDAALLAWADAHPDDARAVEAKAKALASMMSVTIVGQDGEERAAGNEIKLAAGEDGLHVAGPKGLQVRLTLDDKVGSDSVEVALPDLLRTAGLPDDRLPDGSLLTTPRFDGTVGVTLPNYFCQPPSSTWTLRAKSGDLERSWVVTTPTSCVQMVDEIIAATPVKKKK